MKKIIQSKKFKIMSVAIGVFLTMFLIFGAGVAVGLRKARFSSDFGKNYEKNFMGSHFDGGRGDIGGGGPIGDIMGFAREFEGRDLRNGHGLAGSIISIDNNNLVIKDREDKENVVVVNENTLIKSQRDNLKIGDLKIDDRIVVMGNPGENGMVNASLIRVFTNNQNN